MSWFLKLFPKYQTLEQMVREGGDRLTKLQDQNYMLSEQNIKLEEEARESRKDTILALKTLANLKIQVTLGGMAPYPEAYSLPKMEEPEVGPLPTGRIQGRDVVRQGIEDFRAQIQQIENKKRPS